MRYTHCVEKERSYASGFSAIGVTAMLSVFILVSATGWQIRETVTDKNVQTSYVATDTAKDARTAGVSATSPALSLPNTGESELGVSILDELVSKYISLQEGGVYTEEAGQKVAEQMAATLKPEVAYTPYTASDIATDPDTTYARMLTYRRDLQSSLTPLLKSTQPEFEIFAYYIDTKDEKYLLRLREVAQDYRDAVSASARIRVPKDAVAEHIAILNALEQFAATLDAMTANASDPFASVALLRTYNEAEAEVFSSFNALAIYYKQKST